MAAETPAAYVIAAATSATTTPDRSLLRCLVDLDITLSLWIHTVCLSIPRWLLKALEISGDGRFWFPIPISLFSFSSRSPILLGLILGSLLDLLLVGLIKHLVRRPRPVYNKGMHLTFAVDHWSFPSGHSSRVFFIAAFLNICADPFRVALDSQRWVHGYFGECYSFGGVVVSAIMSFLRLSSLRMLVNASRVVGNGRSLIIHPRTSSNS